MRVSYEWLADFVDLDGVTPKDAAAVLTRLDLEAEAGEHRSRVLGRDSIEIDEVRKPFVADSHGD